jgi:peptide deformylase
VIKFSPSEIERVGRRPARRAGVQEAGGRALNPAVQPAYPLPSFNGSTSWPNGQAARGKTLRGARKTHSIMALLNILHYPDKRLHKVAKPVEAVDERIRKLVADMAETMYAAPGVGLAATQVDVHERVIVIDVSETHDELRVFINPEIVWSSNERKLSEEGCLSVPGIYDNVERAEKVRVRALNEKGETYELDCDGLLAVCIQHEMDHLMGRVFVEYLSSLKQTRIKSKMKKLERAM